jgi:hypothetical protein
MKNHRDQQAPVKPRKSRQTLMKTQKLIMAALRVWELKHKQQF